MLELISLSFNHNSKECFYWSKTILDIIWSKRLEVYLENGIAEIWFRGMEQRGERALP